MSQKLSSAIIEVSLATRRLGHPTLFFSQTGSTNDVALDLAAGGASDGTLVVADRQTAGRGRGRHEWWSPAGSSLLISLLLRPDLPAASAGQLTMCLGLAAIEGVERVTGLQPALKWPNDLLLDGRKLAGMLTELRLSGDRVDYAVLGLGLNVNLSFRAQLDHLSVPPEGDPSESAGLAETAISLQMALGSPVERLPLLAAILSRCEAWYDDLLAGHSPAAAWSAHLDTLGRRVQVVSVGDVYYGLATGVSPEGALIVQTDDGGSRTVWAGDVTSLRIAAS